MSCLAIPSKSPIGSGLNVKSAQSSSTDSIHRALHIAPHMIFISASSVPSCILRPKNGTMVQSESDTHRFLPPSVPIGSSEEYNCLRCGELRSLKPLGEYVSVIRILSEFSSSPFGGRYPTIPFLGFKYDCNEKALDMYDLHPRDLDGRTEVVELPVGVC